MKPAASPDLPSFLVSARAFAARRTLAFSLLALAPLFLSACNFFALPLTMGANAFRPGDLISTEPMWFEHAFDNALLALDEGGYPVTVEKKTSSYARVRTIAADERKIRIDLTRVDEKSTEFKIRVGRMGNEDDSRAILKQIRTRVKE